MTVNELNQYRSICREILEINVRLKETETYDSVKGSSKDYPFIYHVMRVDGAARSRENDILLQRLHKCLYLKDMIEKFVYNIEDSMTRRIFTLRYICGENRPSWVRIAYKLGGGNTDESVRKRHNRYLKCKQKGEV